MAQKSNLHVLDLRLHGKKITINYITYILSYNLVCNSIQHIQL